MSAAMEVQPYVDPRDRGGAAQPMLIARELQRYFRVKGAGKGAVVRAVDGVSFTLFKGETLGVVGESGCGKSTLARLLLHLVVPDSGELVFDGDAVGETGGILVKVGLRPDLFGPRYPHELSGGQKQRVNIARALAVGPRMVILDEAVSALDKSVEAQVLNLLRQLKRTLNLTYLFISHDLNVVRYISDRVLVMYLGQVVELGPAAEVFARARHPYTRALLGSRLSMDAGRRIEAPPLVGDPPSPIDPPSGCRFRTRCPHAESVCEARMPTLGHWEDRSSHVAACHMTTPDSGHSLAGSA